MKKVLVEGMMCQHLKNLNLSAFDTTKTELNVIGIPVAAGAFYSILKYLVIKK